MSFTSNPITPTAGETFTAQNPAAGAGNLSSQAVIVKNVSPYLLSVADGSGSTVGLVDPYTTDLVPLGANTGQQIEVTPTDLGLLPPGSVPPVIYLTWYAQSETVPGNYPFALPLTTIINDSTTPIPVVTVGGMAYVSLTGAGETATPGDLTQLGGFTVTDAAGDGITLDSGSGTAHLELDGGGNASLYSVETLFLGNADQDAISLRGDSIDAAGGLVQFVSSGDSEYQSTAGNLRLIAGTSGDLSIVLASGANSITIASDLLGFFASSPVGPQVSGGTAAGAIAGLVALGLFSS